jgi:PAS domain S-box-containing protein
MEIRELRIAVVEDNAHDAFLLKEMLQNSQQNASVPVFFQIREFFSIRDAEQDFAKNTYDLILLDLFLPDSRGLDTFKLIVKYVYQIPTILLTGLNDDSIAMEAVKLGAQDFLVKGQIDENILLRSINYAMERHKLVRESKENETRLKSIYSQSPMGIALYEADGSLDFANDALLQFFGIDDIEKLRSYRLSDAPFVNPELLDTLEQKGSVKFEKTIDFCKLKTLSTNNCINYYSIVINQLQTEQAGYLVILQDITEQREIQNKLRAYNEKIKTELLFAARLQQSLEPPDIITEKTYRIYTRYIPCEEIGGDYLEIINVDSLIFIISGDVSGHGLIAALFTFLLRGIIKTILAGVIDTLSLLEKVAAEIQDYLIEGYFITMSVMLIDPDERTLYYTRAGHPPFIIYNDKNVEVIGKKSSFISPIIPKHRWDTNQVKLKPNDKVFLFTDGLFEIQDAKNGNLLGVNYIRDLVHKNLKMSPPDMIDAIIADLKNKSGSDVFEDDISTFVFEQIE